MRLALVATVVFAAAGMLAATAAADNNPWHPLATNGPQHVTLHILPDVHGREAVLDPNFAVVPGAVTLTVVNESRQAHSFTIPQLHVNAVVLPGSPAHPQTATIHFNAPSVGTYRWHCDFCPAVHHRGTMHGTLYALVSG